MRRRVLGVFALLAACSSEVVVEDDPNARYHERYGENWVPQNVDEYCEATTYKVPAECDIEKVCHETWKQDEIPDQCWDLLRPAWACSLEAEWVGCGEQECWKLYRAFRECYDGYYAMTSSSSTSSASTGSQGGAGFGGSGGGS